MTQIIKGPIARRSRLNEDDVQLIKKHLNWLGYYKPPKNIGITGITDQQIFDAIKQFQRDLSLEVTGEIKPDDDTDNLIKTMISKKLKGESV